MPGNMAMDDAACHETCLERQASTYCSARLRKHEATAYLRKSVMILNNRSVAQVAEITALESVFPEEGAVRLEPIERAALEMAQQVSTLQTVI